MKFRGDDRYSLTKIVTHDGESMDSTHVFDSHLNNCDSLFEYDSVAFDEGQFFEKLPMVAERLADEGKHVAIAALNSTFYRSGFPPVMDLFSKVETIKLLSSPCALCSNSGYFTSRRDSTSLIDQKNAVFRPLIGGPEAYIVLCRRCFLNRIKQNF